MYFISILLPYHRPREIGRTWLWAELEKLARFKKLQSSSIVFQNDLAFLGQIGIASLSEFPEIYGLTDSIEVNVNQVPGQQRDGPDRRRTVEYRLRPGVN